MSLLSWMEEGVTLRQLPKFIIGSALVSIIVSIIGLIIITRIGLDISSGVAKMTQLTTMAFLTKWVVAFFLEEMLFRAPLYVPIYFGWTNILIPCVIILSGIFGWLHGGIGNIFIQGLAGLVFSIVFLKCGGMQREFWKGLFSSTATHTASNALIIILSRI